LGFVVGTLVADTWDCVTRKESLDGLLVIVTGMLATFTYFLFRATRGLLRHTPQVERAYISGGGVPVMEVAEYTASTSGPTFPESSPSITYVPIPKPTGQFELHINNHGKTPGSNLPKLGSGSATLLQCRPRHCHGNGVAREWLIG
jgi:hypothetical protein